MKKWIKSCLIFTLILFLTGCGSSNQQGIGLKEEVMVHTSDGDYSVKVTRVEHSTINSNPVIVITYELKNYSIDALIERDEYYFTAYDKNDSFLNNQIISTSNTCKVSMGNTETCQIAYAYDSSINYVKLKFYDDYLSGDYTELFILEW